MKCHCGFCTKCLKEIRIMEKELTFGRKALVDGKGTNRTWPIVKSMAIAILIQLIVLLLVSTYLPHYLEETIVVVLLVDIYLMAEYIFSKYSSENKVKTKISKKALVRKMRDCYNKSPKSPNSPIKAVISPIKPIISSKHSCPKECQLPCNKDLRPVYLQERGTLASDIIEGDTNYPVLPLIRMELRSVWVYLVLGSRALGRVVGLVWKSSAIGRLLKSDKNQVLLVVLAILIVKLFTTLY